MSSESTAPTLRGGTGEERIRRAFAEAPGDAALVAYAMGGFPDLETSRQVLRAYVEGGADVVELGIPYSDPLADGPIIHAAGTTALEAGVTVDDVLELGRELSGDVAVVLMTYANLVLRPGVDVFARRLAEAGFSGLIVPDLPIGEEATDVIAACDAAGVAFIPLIAPTTGEERVAEVRAAARGFLYAVSVVGTTGERSGSPADRFGEIVARAKGDGGTDVPVAIGFGIGDAEGARAAAAAGADGAIVGSRLVRAAGEERPVEAVRAVLADLTSGLGR